MGLSVALIFSIVCLPVAWAAFDTIPQTLIQFVPFTVFDNTKPTISVRISTSQNCGVNAEGGAAQNLNGQGAATFTVTDQQPNLWLCDGTTNTLFRALTMNPMSFTPKFAFQGQPRTFQYSGVTPVGVMVQYMTYSNCKSSDSDIVTATINSNRLATATLVTSMFACVTVLAEATQASHVVNTGLVMVTPPMGFAPTTVIFSDVVTFTLTGSAPGGAPVKLSIPTDCSGNSAAYTPGGQYGLDITTEITVNRGTYEFCIQIAPNVFASMGQLTVLKYGATPTTAFMGRATVYTLTLDSPRSTTAIITADAECSERLRGPLNPSALTGELTAVTINSLGTFFVCVQTLLDNSKYIMATPVNVVPPTDITIRPDPISRGLLTSISLIPALSTLVMFAPLGDCFNPFFQLQTDTPPAGSPSMGSFVMPVSGPTSTLSYLQICVRTQDGTATYPIRTVQVQDFSIVHEALIAGFPRNVTFDVDTPMSTKIHFGPACGSSLVSTRILNEERLSYVTFPVAGVYHVCVEVSAQVTSDVGQLTVFPFPTFTPNVSLTQEPTTFTLRNTAANSRIIFGLSCTEGVIYQQLSTGGAVLAMTVTFPALGLYMVCAEYQTSDGQYQLITIGNINVADMTSSPVYHVIGIPTFLQFQIPGDADGGKTITSKFFLSKSNCGVVIDPTYPITLGVAFFTPVELGTFTVCAQTTPKNVVQGEPPYIPAGTVTIMNSPNVTFREAYSPTHLVPFTLLASGNWIPVTYAFSTKLSQCAKNIVFEGFFGPGGVSESLTLSTGVYALCARAPDNLGLLFSRNFNVSKFVSVTSTFVANQAAVVSTIPVFPFPLHLSVSSTCDQNQYSGPIADGQVANFPVGIYYMCVVGPTFRAPSYNQVVVVSAFSAAFPSEMRGNVPFNITVASDTPTGGILTVYILVNMSRPCNVLVDQPAAYFFGSSNTKVELLILPNTPVTVCALSADQTVSMRIGDIDPLPYQTPHEIVKGTPTTIRSGRRKSGLARLTSDVQCQLALWGPGPIINYHIADVRVPTTFVPSTGYWCESDNFAADWERMDDMGLLSEYDARPGVVTHPPIPLPLNSTYVPNGEFMPGVPFEINIPPSIGHSPFLSLSRDCDERYNSSVGIFPKEGESLNFHVCITSPGGTVFTTYYPTMNFSNFAVEPREMLSIDSTMIHLIPAVPRFVQNYGDGVFFSRSSQCTRRIGPFATAVRPLLFNSWPGRVWVCLEPWAGNFVPVASFMVYAPPVTSFPTEKIFGVPFCFQLSVPFDLYRLETDAEPVIGPRTSREVFIQRMDGRECNYVLAATPVRALSSNDTCLSTAELDPIYPYKVCVPTPIRSVAVFTNLFFAQIEIKPRSRLVADALTILHVDPNISSRVFAIGNDTNCTTPKFAPSFTTNGKGDGQLDLRFSHAWQPPRYFPFSAGAYVLCIQFEFTRAVNVLPLIERNWYMVTDLELYAPSYYSISNNFITTQVPTTVILQEDLLNSAIRGFAAANDPRCQGTIHNGTEVYFTAPESSPRTVEIYYAHNENATYYLCAEAPVNETIVAVDKISFVRPLIEFPTAASACVSLTVGFVNEEDPLSQVSDTNVVVHEGSCCLSPTTHYSENRVVTKATRGDGRVRTLLSIRVPEAAMDRWAPKDTFHLCISNVRMGACVDLGTMKFTRDECLSTSIPNISVDLSRRLPNGLYLGAPPTPERPAGIVEIIILAVAFLIVLIICIILFTICASRHKTRQIPPDDSPIDTIVGSPKAASWRDNFDGLFDNNRTKQPHTITLHNMLHVPIDMTLNTCCEAPICIQQLLRDESFERSDIERSEQIVFGRFQKIFEVEFSQVMESIRTAERAAVVGTAISFMEQEYVKFFDLEEECRDRLWENEEVNRLQVAEMERTGWRTVMDRQQQQLDRTLQREHQFTHSRRRRLMEASSQMLAHMSSVGIPQHHSQFRDTSPNQGELPLPHTVYEDPTGNPLVQQRLPALRGTGGRGPGHTLTPLPQTASRKLGYSPATSHQTRGQLGVGREFVGELPGTPV